MTDSSFPSLAAPVEPHVFLTNTALVLTMINGSGTIRMREMAQRIGIAEQGVQAIVDYLVSEGYVVVDGSGTKNVFRIRKDRVLGYPFNDCPLGSFLALCDRQD